MACRTRLTTPAGGGLERPGQEHRRHGQDEHDGDGDGDADPAPLDPVTALAARLERRNTVLLLDGCQQARAACAELADRLVSAAPHLRILATSRQPLGCSSEAVYEVPTLSAPDPFRLPPLDGLGQYDAVRLFVDRAADARPGFDVRAGDAPAVAQICRRFDAIPLALELVAARAGSATLAQIVAEVAEASERLPLLAGGRRSSADQEATVRAAVDWAYRALPHPERVLFDRLSVFAGGFTPAAAAAVFGPTDALDVEAALAGLVRRPVVRTDGVRWWLHEPLRRYGARKLADSGHDHATRARHLEWALAVADVDAGVEHANLLAALDWAVSERRTAAADRLACAVGRFWDVRLHLDDSRRWLRPVWAG